MSSMHSNPFDEVTLRQVLAQLLRLRRSIFVSYHHDVDQPYYDAFDRIIAGTYGVVRNNSLDTEFDSEDTEYVMRAIRERYIVGTSCTIVLCGRFTPWRKYIDWEIKASLDLEHGLLGVKLPTNPVVQGGVYKPARLQDNVDSGYAVWVHWEALVNSAILKYQIETAIARAPSLINNTRPLRGRNGPP
jgi:hypothetical protein